MDGKPKNDEAHRLERVNVMLSAKALSWLEETSTSIRGETGARLSRSALIRGIVEGFAAAELAIRRCSTGEDVAVALEAYLRETQGRNAQ